VAYFEYPSKPSETKGAHPVKRIVNLLNKLNRAQRAYAVLALWAATAIAMPAQTFTTLHSFDGTEGKQPVAALVQTTNGDLYGTTTGAGSHNVGTAFKISPSGTLKTLHDFCSQTNTAGDCLDGAIPEAPLIQAPNGDLYGTTIYGGNNDFCPNQCGVIFKMNLSGTLNVIYDFCPDGGGTADVCKDGENPISLLVQAGGDFYGTTAFGGKNTCHPLNGCGTVFKITTNGATQTTLHTFCAEKGCADGAEPSAGLFHAADSDFYGTTVLNGAYGGGTVFEMTASGTLTTIHSFCEQSACADGSSPNAALIQVTNGNLYGTTLSGGANGAGTIFQIAGGTLTTLYSFCSVSGCPDGSSPSGLMQGSDGNFYGTTNGNGANGKGTIFEITPGGTLTTLYSFCAQSGCPDGESANALMQDTNGIFYGTTYTGGANKKGTVFSLSVGLGPFVETQTSSGAVGAAVVILGTDLTSATSVTFNGTAAKFTVVSNSEITTTVPAGATTGTVKVVTHSGTLSSNAPFRVHP
jgi:uncharacterized repeat protein (TIGR03803 family)